MCLRCSPSAASGYFFALFVGGVVAELVRPKIVSATSPKRQNQGGRPAADTSPRRSVGPENLP
jgi:hypothetical protein